MAGDGRHHQRRRADQMMLEPANMAFGKNPVAWLRTAFTLGESGARSKALSQALDEDA